MLSYSIPSSEGAADIDLVPKGPQLDVGNPVPGTSGHHHSPYQAVHENMVADYLVLALVVYCKTKSHPSFHKATLYFKINTFSL
jgi:hypothetical protein